MACWCNLCSYLEECSCDESSTSDNWLTSSTSCDESSPSSSQAVSRVGSFLSLIDLVDEEFQGESDSLADIFGSGFPSPTRDGRRMRPCKTKEPTLCTPSNCEEPLFWPFDDNSYNLQSGFDENFLRLSPPCRKVLSTAPPNDRLVEPREGQLKNQPQVKGCKRRLVFDSKSVPVKLPSSYAMRKKLCDIESGGLQESKASRGLSDLFSWAQGGLSIEAMVGLTEFDGGESLADNLTKDWFDLDQDSLPLPFQVAQSRDRDS